MGHNDRKEFSIAVVKGGFILSTSAGGEYETEVFPTASKLIKHLRQELEGDKAEKTDTKAAE